MSQMSGLKTNLDYWKISLDNPEPDLPEEFYTHDELIIEDEKYLQAVSRLRELITTYCTLVSINDPEGKLEDALDTVLTEIDRLLKRTKNIHHTEFVAYFKCHGVSFRNYKKALPEQRLHILKSILQAYLGKRKPFYDSVGYTPVIHQALYDSTVSRKQGSSGANKLKSLIEEVTEMTKVSLVEKIPLLFSGNNFCFYFIANDDEGSFKQIRESFKLKYEFGSTHDGKLPDLIVKIGNRLLIVEAKHIMESGGGQDKQINELIEFIRQTESNDQADPAEPENTSQQDSVPSVSYVAFLDGMYFNKFVQPNEEPEKRKHKKYTKVDKQRESIEAALSKYPGNYFVNTEGMRQLLRDLMTAEGRFSETDHEETSETVYESKQVAES